MSKRIALYTLAICLILSLAACKAETKQEQNTAEQVTHADMEIFDYEDLKAKAKLIVKVSVLDDLTENNSHFIYDDYDTDKPILDYYGLRKVRILETYKDELNQKETALSVAEAAAIKEKTVYHYQGYTPMKKGGTYILFLDNDTASGNLSVISCENGRVDVDNASRTDEEFYEIAAKSFIDFDTALPQREKQKLIEADIEKSALASNTG